MWKYFFCTNIIFIIIFFFPLKGVTRMNDINLLRVLEQCIRMGRPLLIEDIGETLDPALESTLQKATFKQGGRVLIRIGDGK